MNNRQNDNQGYPQINDNDYQRMNNDDGYQRMNNNNDVLPPRDPYAQTEGFKWFPTEQNIVPGEAALMLRYHFWLLLIMHGFFFVLFELFIYHVQFFLIFAEFVYAFVAFHSIMTLNTTWIYLYMALMVSSVFSLGYIGAVGNIICAIFFVFQIAFYLFVGMFLTCRRLGAFKEEMEQGIVNNAGANDLENMQGKFADQAGVASGLPQGAGSAAVDINNMVKNGGPGQPAGWKPGEFGKEKPQVKWSLLKQAALGAFDDAKAAAKSKQAQAVAGGVRSGFDAGVSKVSKSNLNKDMNNQAIEKQQQNQEGNLKSGYRQTYQNEFGYTTDQNQRKNNNHWN